MFLCVVMYAGAALSAESTRPPVKVVIADRASGWNAALGKEPRGASKEGEVTWRHSASGGTERELVTEITNTSDRLRCMAIEYHFFISGKDLAPFLTGVNPEPEWPEDGELAYAYVRESMDWQRLSVPFAALSSKTDGRGISLALGPRRRARASSGAWR